MVRRNTALLRSKSVKSWRRLGESDPYFGVLASDEFRAENITDKGKNVGRLEVTFDGDGRRTGFVNRIVKMDESYKDHPAILRLIDEYKTRLEELDYHPQRDDEEGLTSISAARSGTANRFMGAESCKACHPGAYETWSRSRHAHAFHTLEKKRYHVNPRCLKCHTVGYMASDGYVNRKLTPGLKNVSCESCHGRGRYHVLHHTGKPVPVKRVIMKKVGCTGCHNPDNSPRFDYAKYWPKIRHGKD